MKKKRRHAAALCAAVGAATAALMAASVVVVRARLLDAGRLEVARHTQASRAALQQALDDHLDGLTDLSQVLGAAPPVNDDEYRELAVRAAARGPAFTAVNFLDHRFVEKFLYPYGPNRAIQGLDLKTRLDALPAANRAVSERKPAATDPVPLAQGGEGFLAYAPVRRQDRWEGLVEGAMDIDSFSRRYVTPALPAGHQATLLSESSDRPFFQTAPRTAPFGSNDFYFTVRFADRRWWVVLSPPSEPAPLTTLVLLLMLELAAGAFAVRKIIS